MAQSPIQCQKQFTLTVLTAIPPPFAYWKMDEASGATRNDSIGTNNLTTFGGGTVTQEAGKISFSAGMAAPGTPGLRLSNNVNFSYAGTGFTICGWFFLPTYSGFANLAELFTINFETGGGVSVGLYQLFCPSEGFPGPVGDVPFMVGWYHNLGADTIDSPATTTFNAWHFFRAWYDPADSKLHLQIDNGTKLSSATAFAQANAARADISTDTNTQTFRIDEVGFWKEVLTDAAATALYNSGNGLTYPF